jgi:hypothetical protein
MYMREGHTHKGRKQANQYPTPEIKTEEDLLPPGALPGTVPTDLEQATGLERLEILGKMEGVDIFDMKPLDASRKGRILGSRESSLPAVPPFPCCETESPSNWNTRQSSDGGSCFLSFCLLS